jgi:transcriptional regulator with XRE-family HTH domain
MARATFAERLRVARERRDLSQIALARLSGIDQAQLAHYEGGARQPSVDNLRSLVIALDVSADFLLGIIKETRRP